jgi:hypothetical protein
VFFFYNISALAAVVQPVLQAAGLVTPGLVALFSGCGNATWGCSFCLTLTATNINALGVVGYKKKDTITGKYKPRQLCHV